MQTQLTPIPYMLVFVVGIHLGFTDVSSLFGIKILLAFLLFGYFTPSITWIKICIGIGFMAIGFYTAQMNKNVSNQHYSQQIAPKIENEYGYLIEQPLRASISNYRYYVKIKEVNGEYATGKLLLQLKKNESTSPLTIGAFVKSYGVLQPIHPPKNPSDFDFKGYLFTHSIYHQLTISETDITHTEKENSSILLGMKQFAIQRINEAGWNQETKELIKTMLLGDRTGLERETLDRFAQAGVIHLLAISGLHIGLFMLFFRWLFSPLKRLKRGIEIQSLCVIISLWCYAVLVGLPPSVFRSVVMFTAFQLGFIGSQRYPTAYLLLLSMVVLLVLNPRLILQLGFQLSYLAVFGIATIKPLLHIVFQNKILHRFWELTTVTLAAQIAVAPLTVYYFNQFPGLFLVANWLLLPIIGYFLYGSFIEVLRIAFGLFPTQTFLPLDFFASWIQKSVDWVAQQESFVFKNLSIQKMEVLLCYIVLFFLFQLWIKSSKRVLLYSAITGIGLILFMWYSEQHLQEKIWVWHKYKNTYLIHPKNGVLHIYTSDSLPQPEFTAPILRYFNSDRLSVEPLQKEYKINNQRLLIVDGSWIFNQFREDDILLVHNNPKIHMDRLFDTLQPALVILDASNSSGYKKRWKKTFQTRGIPWYDTQISGAYSFILETQE